ncbi:MAG: hypothetical protein WAU05_12435 [Nitrospira sp.]
MASVMWLVTSACSLIQSKIVDEVLVDGPQGAVLLQKAEDGWFGTAHPLSLSPAVVSSVFQGVQVQTSLIDKAPGERVFSDKDIEFLTPLVRTALSKATKSQVVGFRVLHDTESRQETTGGILYIQGRLLHLTLTHYRARQEGTGQDSVLRRLTPNPTGLEKHQITFSPEAARLSSRNEQPDVTAATPLASLVLDYETLTVGSPRPSTLNAVPVDENRESQVPVMKKEKETELESLKEEMRQLQRRLDDLDSGMSRPTTP